MGCGHARARPGGCWVAGEKCARRRIRLTDEVTSSSLPRRVFAEKFRRTFSWRRDSNPDRDRSLTHGRSNPGFCGMDAKNFRLHCRERNERKLRGVNWPERHGSTCGLRSEIAPRRRLRTAEVQSLAFSIPSRRNSSLTAAQRKLRRITAGGMGEGPSCGPATPVLFH